MDLKKSMKWILIVHTSIKKLRDALGLLRDKSKATLRAISRNDVRLHTERDHSERESFQE